MTDNDDFGEKELRKLKGQLHAAAYDLEHRVKSSKGAFTRKGQTLDYGESHTAEIALGLTVLGYILSGAWLAIYTILGAKALWDHYGKRQEAHPLLRQIASEFHYYVIVAAGTSLVFEWAGYRPPDLPLTLTGAIRVLMGL